MAARMSMEFLMGGRIASVHEARCCFDVRTKRSWEEGASVRIRSIRSVVFFFISVGRCGAVERGFTRSFTEAISVQKCVNLSKMITDAYPNGWFFGLKCRKTEGQSALSANLASKNEICLTKSPKFGALRVSCSAVA